MRVKYKIDFIFDSKGGGHPSGHGHGPWPWAIIHHPSVSVHHPSSIIQQTFSKRQNLDSSNSDPQSFHNSPLVQPFPTWLKSKILTRQGASFQMGQRISRPRQLQFRWLSENPSWTEKQQVLGRVTTAWNVQKNRN